MPEKCNIGLEKSCANNLYKMFFVYWNLVRLQADARRAIRGRADGQAVDGRAAVRVQSPGEAGPVHGPSLHQHETAQTFHHFQSQI